MSEKPLTDIAFSTLGLHPKLLCGLEDAGFTQCTPIQKMTLPLALRGKDIAGQAQTGTGKTLAFLVTVLNRILSQPALDHRTPKDPRGLILAPTRELAIQIYNDAKRIASKLQLRFALIYGGLDYEKQRERLQQGVDIIIATPGRLIDYVKQHNVVRLRACEICVLDEADRMLDLGFIKDVRFLLRALPSQQRQTLLFSSTLSHRILELSYEHMQNPEKVVVESDTVTVERVSQRVYFPAEEEKIPLLIGLLAQSAPGRALVFVNTKAVVSAIAHKLERQGYRVSILSGDIPQAKRQQLLSRFQKNQLDILVTTDVAARGLHIDGLSYVYNYDLPYDPEDYVHRIGRTARLGAKGDAVSFACERYAVHLPQIEQFIAQKIPVYPITKELLQPQPVHRSNTLNVENEPLTVDISTSDLQQMRNRQVVSEPSKRNGQNYRDGGKMPLSQEGRRSRGLRRRRHNKPWEKASEDRAPSITPPPQEASAMPLEPIVQHAAPMPFETPPTPSPTRPGLFARMRQWVTRVLYHNG